MVRYKTFYGNMDGYKEHDLSVQTFIKQLCENQHSFIGANTIVVSNSVGNLTRLRTEIIYKENPTRKVITEKTEK